VHSGAGYCIQEQDRQRRIVGPETDSVARARNMRGKIFLRCLLCSLTRVLVIEQIWLKSSEGWDTLRFMFSPCCAFVCGALYSGMRASSEQGAATYPEACVKVLSQIFGACVLQGELQLQNDLTGCHAPVTADKSPQQAHSDADTEACVHAVLYTAQCVMCGTLSVCRECD
jgi:hypothetical protein